MEYVLNTLEKSISGAINEVNTNVNTEIANRKALIYRTAEANTVIVGDAEDTLNLLSNGKLQNNGQEIALYSDVEDILEPYTVNLTNLLSAQDSESISTAIGGIDNLNATVTKNQVIFGTLANGTVAVGIRVLGNQTTLTYFVDSLVGLTVNEVIITNTSGTLSKTVNTHSVLTENMVINSLTSDETTLPLSAAQGKALNEKILNSGKVYVIDGSILSEDSPTSEQISEAIGGWDNLANAIRNDNIILIHTTQSRVSHYLTAILALAGGADEGIQIWFQAAKDIVQIVFTKQSETISLGQEVSHLIDYYSNIDELQTTNKTIVGSINEIHTIANSKADSQDITDAINALDKAEVSAGTGEIISAVSQENGIVNVSKRSLTSDDIPTLPQSKIEDLTDTLAGKQDTLVFNTPYDASTNKAATMQDITAAVSDKVEQSDITTAIQALDSTGQTCSEGEVISSVSQEDGVVTVQKKTLTIEDLPVDDITKKIYQLYPYDTLGDDISPVGLSENEQGEVCITYAAGRELAQGISSSPLLQFIIPKAVLGTVGELKYRVGLSNDTFTSLSDYFTVQNKLTAGTGLEITEDNIINITLDTTVFFVAEQLPASPTDEQKKKICLIPAVSTSVNNEYTEYVWVVDDTHPNGYWEEFGTYTSEVDLTNYLKSADAASTYLSKTDAASTYATQANLTAHTGNTENPHNVTAAQVGLGNVNNTSDADKPISTATQNALNGKQATLVSGTNIKTLNGESLLDSGNITTYTPSSIDVTTLFADTASIASGISTQIAALGNSGVTEFPVLYAGSAIGNIKPTWIRTTSGVTNMMCIADNKIWYFEIQGTTVQRASLAIS